MSDRHLEIHIPNDRDKLYSVIKYPAGELQVRLTDAGLLAVVKAATLHYRGQPGSGYNNGLPKQEL